MTASGGWLPGATARLMLRKKRGEGAEDGNEEASLGDTGESHFRLDFVRRFSRANAVRGGNGTMHNSRGGD